MRTPFYISAILCFCLYNLSAQTPKKATTLPDWKVKPSELKALNSPNRDINLSITPNGRYLYFMSGRGLQPWSQPNYTTFRGRPEADGDVWFAEKKNGEWGEPQCLQAPVNTGMGEDEPNISADGQTVYFQSWRRDWASSGGPYYRAELHGDRWENPRGLGSGINRFFQSTGFATDGMSIAPNGRVMVIACGPQYDGPMDIFISRRDEDGVWSVPERLDVSTRQDERSVFIGADSKTLYFASNGWGGFGKLDIFKTTLEGGASTGELINIGKPFNTPDEDYGFVLDAPRNDVYFVREGDIYYANLGDNVDARIKPQPVVIINGLVREKGKGFLESNLFLLHNESDEIFSKARSNALSGEYSMSFPRYPGEFTIRVNFAEGYPSIEKKVSINDQTPEVIEISFEVDPAIPVPEPVKPVAPVAKPPEPKTEAPAPSQNTLARVLFAFDQAVLNEAARQELATIAEAAKKANRYTLTIIGHTDDAGAAEYNQQLSERRAKAVADYFAAQGLTATIAAKGELLPAVANDSEGNKAKNRRVEVVLEYQY